MRNLWFSSKLRQMYSTNVYQKLNTHIHTHARVHARTHAQTNKHTRKNANTNASTNTNIHTNWKDIFLGKWATHNSANFQGPVVQSVVSLTSSFRVISLTVLANSIYNILIFFAEKMWVAFALQKLLTFFQQKISAYLRITQLKF